MTESLPHTVNLSPEEQVFLLTQIQWLVCELEYAELKMNIEISNTKFRLAQDPQSDVNDSPQNTDDIRKNRFNGNNNHTASDVMKNHFSRFETFDNNGAYMLAQQQLGKLANLFADKAVWLAKQINISQNLDVNNSENTETTLQDIHDTYTPAKTYDDPFVTLNDYMQTMTKQYQNGNLRTAYKIAINACATSLQIWADYYNIKGLAEFPKPGVPSGGI